MSSNRPRVLITRPQDQAEKLAARLIERGVDARCLPLFRIEPIEFSLPTTGPRRMVFVSANAVHCSLEQLRPLLQRENIELFAIGPATAAALQAAGLSSQMPPQGFRSEELLESQGSALAQGSTWVVCGRDGRERIQCWLRERGAQVESIYCYRREARADAVAALASLAGQWQPDYVSLMSGETLERFASALEQNALQNWRDIALLVPSARVLARARQLGFSNLLLLSDATESSLLDFLAGLPRG